LAPIGDQFQPQLTGALLAVAVHQRDKIVPIRFTQPGAFSRPPKVAQHPLFKAESLARSCSRASAADCFRSRVVFHSPPAIGKGLSLSRCGFHAWYCKGQPIPLHITEAKATPPASLLSYTTEQADQLELLAVLQGNTAPANPPAGTMTRTLTLQVTEVLFDFDDADFSTEERQLVVDSVVGNMFEVEVFDENNLDEIADAIVEEVTDYSQWCVVSLNYRHILNTY
jgi:hypothetical protein